jgi:LmbE family N-acetylglucosaminyl deacetylase
VAAMRLPGPCVLAATLVPWAVEAAEPARPRTLLAVFAHPDDEAVRVHLAIATDGRYGVRDFAASPAGEPLVKVRAVEAR